MYFLFIYLSMVHGYIYSLVIFVKDKAVDFVFLSWRLQYLNQALVF